MLVKFVYSFVCGFLAMGLLPTMAEESVIPLPVAIAPDNHNLYYMGRFDMANSSVPICAWPGSAIGIRFHGTAITAQLLPGLNRFQVIVDGVATKVLTAAPNTSFYNLASGLSDVDHTVIIFKDTEAAVGAACFSGFQLNEGATILPYPKPVYRLEVIGDSISCGYGNEETDPHQHFSPTTENAYLSYGAVAARAFNADYTCIAWSGKKLWPDNTIVDLYARILPEQPTPNPSFPARDAGRDTVGRWANSVWKFDGAKPQAVVINLCTNDFGRANPEEEGWVKAYHAFINKIRKNYPDATIYLALGSMMNDSSPYRHPLTDARGYIQRVVKECNLAGDAKIHFIEFAQQSLANGLGADFHPSAKTDQIMADKLIEALQKDLGWVLVSNKP